MRIVEFSLLLTLVVLPTSLFAQITSSSTGSSGNSLGSEVENVSAAGGFIGGGRPDAFVGTSEIYNTSSTRSTSSTSRASNSRVATTPRRTATSTAAMQRRAGTMGGFSSLGSSQNIRSVTSLDSDMAVSPVQRPQPAVDTHLARLNGIQDSRVTFTQTPQGTTAILRGTVASERERRVAQQLLLLEPGINRVENLLEIR